ncbi:MAG: hypothetical protein KBT11_06305 [Treponema sp.]|nr:hypothetical protein [Candidatus Treponema equifaecale]
MKKIIGTFTIAALLAAGFMSCSDNITYKDITQLNTDFSEETGGSTIAGLPLHAGEGNTTNGTGFTPSNPSNPGNITDGPSTDPVDVPKGDATLTPATGEQAVTITSGEGWLNSAYIYFNKVSGATAYDVLVDDVKIDDELIREYSNTMRADALGLKAGEHTMKVAVRGKTNYASATMNVVDHDRSGFAFTSDKVPGAYKMDGTLKDKAEVIYVTGATAKTVKFKHVKGVNAADDNEYVGLQNILSEAGLKNMRVPLCVRIIGTITKAQMDSLGSSAEGLQIKTTTKDQGVTVEGVGNDATIWGFGFLIRSAYYTELSNLGIMLCLDDGVSIDTGNYYLWVHNNDIFYGGVGSDADQAKGDGALDFKKSYSSTLSYNHFWDTGKSNLLDASAGTGGSNYVTYHHNWYDHSDSRHPRIRNASAVHVYNNYYDGNAKYGIGITSGASCFAEGNYFRNAHDPMMMAGQGTDGDGAGTFSGEQGGVIKSFNNSFENERDTNGVKFQFRTNLYNYTTKQPLGEYKEEEKTVGTQNPDGSWTIYSGEITKENDTIAGNSFITKVGAGVKESSSGSKYYQTSKEKEAFKLAVSAKTTKIRITGKSASSGVSSVDVKIGSTTVQFGADYETKEIAVSGAKDGDQISVTVGKQGSFNVTKIEVIASEGWKTIVTSGADMSDIDAYEVTSRGDKVPETIKTKLGGHTYSNFDTALGDNGLGLNVLPTSPENAKTMVMTYAGRHNPDFKWEFDNKVDDASYAVNAPLKAALNAYKSGLVKVQGL